MNHALENRLRRAAAARGLTLRKSRARTIRPHDLGGYQLINSARNLVVAGSSFELELEDIAELLGV
jgi:hypothetical protein